MKRKLVIAAVAAAALVGGGTYTAVATTGNGAGAPQLTAAQAAAAALKHTPGVVESVDLDDESKGRWEVDVIGKDAREHELGVDAATGTVRAAKDDDGHDDDADDRADDRAERSALRAAEVDAQQAAATALALQPGTVTSVEFDGQWEVEVHAKDGRDHEVKVDAKTAHASLSGADDGKDAADDSKDGQKDSKDDKGSKEAKDDHDEGSED
jgi:uncharacterized membrane protein YkoI